MTRSRRSILLVLLALIVLVAGWIYWNRPTRTDMAAYVPADSLAFIEIDDALRIVDGTEHTQAWQALAGPIGAQPLSSTNRWLIGLARWTGIGPADAVVLARSQFAIIFSGAEANKDQASITIKPLTVLVIETHTSQRRMKPVLEARLQEFAEKVLNHPALSHKQANGADLSEWSSADGNHRLVAAFAGSVAIVGNDESSVLRCVDVRSGRSPSLSGNQQLAFARSQTPLPPAIFGFIPREAVKPILQAWILNQAKGENAAEIARLFSALFGNIVDGLSCSSNFVDGAAEDRCLLLLPAAVADQLRNNAVPSERMTLDGVGLAPHDSYAVSSYHFRDTDGFWRDLNAIVSSHADVVTAIAAKPFLQGLFKPYGIEDPDSFLRAAGPHVETIRHDETSASVLVTDAIDRPALLKATQQKFGATPRRETIGNIEVISSSDNWSEAFVNNRFLIGSSEGVRACLTAWTESRTLASDEAFQRSQQVVDTSLPIIALTFTEDRKSAISFVEMFSQHERSVFPTQAKTINEASRRLPYAVSVTMLKENRLEWTSRSSFGLLGTLILKFAPENMH